MGGITITNYHTFEHYIKISHLQKNSPLNIEKHQMYDFDKFLFSNYMNYGLFKNKHFKRELELILILVLASCLGRSIIK